MIRKTRTPAIISDSMISARLGLSDGSPEGVRAARSLQTEQHHPQKRERKGDQNNLPDGKVGEKFGGSGFIHNRDNLAGGVGGR